MLGRLTSGALLLIGIALPIVGCTSPQVDTLEVTPATLDMAIGTSAQLTATGVFNHGSGPSTTQNLTDQVTWTTVSSEVATVSSTGMVTATGPGTISITASIHGYTGTLSASSTVTVPPSTTGTGGTDITSVAVIPGSQSVAVPGETGQYIAIGTTASGYQVNLTKSAAWTSSNVSVATVNASGLATAVGAGSTTITALATNSDGTVASGTGTFTVTGTAAGPLLSVSIIPNTQTMNAGQTSQLIAIGSFNSAPSTQNISSTVTWASSNPAVASVAAGGLLTANAQGVCVITAIASNPGGGVVTATATFTVTGTTAASEPLASLAIVPASQTALAINQTANFIAIATTGTGATVNLTGQGATIGTATIKAATWSSSNPTVATINAATGVATALSAGSTAITAQAVNPDGTVVLATAVYTVTVPTSTEPVVSLAIFPASQTLTAINQNAPLIAIATTGTGTTVNVTNQSVKIGGVTVSAAVWTSSNPSVATINSGTGVVTSVSAGTTAITAIASNPDGTVVTGTATITVNIPVTPEPLASLAIVPATQALTAAGQTANLTAIATTATGTTVNLTGLTALVAGDTIPAATWTSSAPSVASVDPATGVVTANGTGVAVITAIASNPDLTVVTGTATINSTAAATTGGPITSITVIPGDQAVASPTETTQFLAIGTTATGATSNLTNSPALTWSSSSAQIAIIGTNTGFATAIGQGSATITALYTPLSGNVVTGTATFNVTGGTTEQYTGSLTILPGAQTLASGGTGQFIALATLGSSGQVVDVTDSPQLSWTTSIPAIATISTSPASPAGVVTGQSAGTTNVTAELTNPDNTVVTGTASVTISTAAPPEEILTLTIYPNTITVLDFQLTGQFLAIGTFSQAPYVRDLTNDPSTTWVSSEPDLFPVTESSSGSGGIDTASAGLVTAYGSGGADIIAESTSKDGTIQVAQATFNCPLVLPIGLSSTPSCYPGEPPPEELLATVTVYNEGLNTTDWEVTGPSATGTPDVIHCGPGWALNGGTGGSVCTATYPLDTVTPSGNPGIVIEAQGGAFGGWSYNCIPSDSQGNYLTTTPLWTATGPNYCVVDFDYNVNGQLTTIDGINQTIGAIFN